MNTKILNSFVRGLTSAWCLDVEFLINTVDKHNIDIEDIIESVEMNFWAKYKCDFNYNFIDENRELFEDTENDEYEIFTNYVDSHVRFKDEYIQRKFEEYY